MRSVLILSPNFQTRAVNFIMKAGNAPTAKAMTTPARSSLLCFVTREFNATEHARHRQALSAHGTRRFHMPCLGPFELMPLAPDGTTAAITYVRHRSTSPIKLLRPSSVMRIAAHAHGARYAVAQIGHELVADDEVAPAFARQNFFLQSSCPSDACPHQARTRTRPGLARTSRAVPAQSMERLRG